MSITEIKNKLKFLLILVSNHYIIEENMKHNREKVNGIFNTK